METVFYVLLPFLIIGALWVVSMTPAGGGVWYRAIIIGITQVFLLLVIITDWLISATEKIIRLISRGLRAPERR